MKNTILALSIAVALTGCDKDKAAPKKDPAPAPAVGSGTPAADQPASTPTPTPTPAPAPADPTASWTEQKGTGFVVKAPNVGQEKQMTSPEGQPVTMYLGYTPAGFEGAFQAAVSDFSAVAKDAKREPKQMVDDGIQGVLDNMGGGKIEKDEPIEGGDAGRAITASGNHPQGGPFSLHARAYVRAQKLYLVQALYADPTGEPLAAAFVNSFKLVD